MANVKKPKELEEAEKLFGEIGQEDLDDGITESGWICAYLAGKITRKEALVIAKQFGAAMDKLLDYALGFK